MKYLLGVSVSLLVVAFAYTLSPIASAPTRANFASLKSLHPYAGCGVGRMGHETGTRRHVADIRDPDRPVSAEIRASIGVEALARGFKKRTAPNGDTSFTRTRPFLFGSEGQSVWITPSGQVWSSERRSKWWFIK